MLIIINSSNLPMGIIGVIRDSSHCFYGLLWKNLKLDDTQVAKIILCCIRTTYYLFGKKEKQWSQHRLLLLWFYQTIVLQLFYISLFYIVFLHLYFLAWTITQLFSYNFSELSGIYCVTWKQLHLFPVLLLSLLLLPFQE